MKPRVEEISKIKDQKSKSQIKNQRGNEKICVFVNHFLKLIINI
ncbi:MAG: hypothetical protein AAB788_01765 [Patescibacteria group bacterium]